MNILKYKYNFILLLIIQLIVFIIIGINLFKIEFNPRVLNFFIFISLIVGGIFYISFYYLLRNIEVTINKEKLSGEQENFQKDAVLNTEEMLNKVENQTFAKFETLEKFTNITENVNNLETYSNKLLQFFAGEFNIAQGIIFYRSHSDHIFKSVAKFEHFSKEKISEFTVGEGLHGQVALTQKLLYLKKVPESYISVFIGNEIKHPENLLILPLVYSNRTIGIIELASFSEFDNNIIERILGFTEKISEEFYSIIEANVTT
ncbi:MAG: GAF domain-containing protein [Bacteroidia bacterium]|nr:GAF domain-containing protein [Bacteroidia bacterium]